MTWINRGKGIFILHDSDSYCRSLISKDDVAEILEIPTRHLEMLNPRPLDGTQYLDELEVHRALGRMIVWKNRCTQIMNAGRLEPLGTNRG